MMSSLNNSQQRIQTVLENNEAYMDSISQLTTVDQVS